MRYDHPLHEGNLRVAATANYDDTLTAIQTPTGAGLWVLAFRYPLLAGAYGDIVWRPWSAAHRIPS